MDTGSDRIWELADERRRSIMKISWPGVVALLISVAGAVVAAYMDHNELALALGGAAVGLLTKFGAIGTAARVLPLCLALGIASGTVGCAKDHQVHDARVARTDFILGSIESGLLLAGQALVVPYETAEARCAAGPADAYDGCIRSWDVAIDTLSTTYHATSASRSGLASNNGGHLVSCIAFMLDDAIQAIAALDLDLPDAVDAGLVTAQGLARMLAVDGACELDSGAP